MNLGTMIFNNFWAKVISLLLAIATWFYVFDLVNTDSFSKKKESVEDVFSRFPFIVKEVPIKPVFVGKSPEGYRVQFEKMKIIPSKIAIFGPEDIIEDMDELKTENIDLGEYTRSVQLRLGINSEIEFMRFKDDAVDIFLPVESLKALNDKVHPEEKVLRNE